MVKVKNKKNFSMSDKLHAKKSKIKFKKELNPFEVHINKEKFKVIGKKSKNDRGLPGVSRMKAIKKRKNTLGYELKLVNKANTFLDKRIGEKSNKISEEDKILARFAAEKIHQHKTKTGKLSKYNLAEDEILTHRGQTLEEIEKFDDPRSDDEDDDEDLMRKRPGNLQGSFVSDANFGGGVLSRSENTDGAMSRKDLIEQLIIESKKRKLEKQKLKEETLDLTEKLDTEWKDLHSVVSKDFNKETESNKPEIPSIIDKLLADHNKKNEEYDKTMRELRFEPRGTPSDRLKSEDEIAKLEKDKLEKLEKDRIMRMQGTVDNVSTKSKHRSADDLDDDFQYSLEPEFMIAYDKEGKLITPLENSKKSNDIENERESSNDEAEESDDENDNKSASGDESGNESDDSLNDLRESFGSSDEDCENIKMKKSNLKTTPSHTTSPHLKKSETVKESLKKNLNNKEDISLPKERIKESIGSESCLNDKIKQDLLLRKEMMEKAQKELPFTFDMPKSYEELAETLDKHSVYLRPTIIDRIIKCNHPSLNEENKQKLGNLLAYLLQYINDLFSEDNISNKSELVDAFKCFNELVCHIHTISQMDPLNAKNCVIEVIKEKYDDFKRNPKKIPNLDTLIFFQLIYFLFPTSDQKHPIVTPCILFMSNILTKSRIKSSVDVTKGLFIVTMLSNYVSLSKRYVPEAINFIKKILSLYIPNDLRRKQCPEMQVELSNKLYSSIQNEDFTEVTKIDKHLPLSFFIDEENKNFVYILVVTLKLLKTFSDLLKDYHCHKIIFKNHFEIIKILIEQNADKDFKNYLDSTISSMKPSKNEFIRLAEKNKMPVAFKTYEPAFDTEFTGKKRRVMSKEKADYQKLLYKHKKEMKGALREIRRDKAFISDIKIKEKLKSDEIRKQKVKRIFSEASLQQGELNALQRSKKRKK